MSERELPAGAVLGPFRIHTPLGEGGMGIVYHAERVSDGEQVALKVLKRELAEDEMYRRRFIREARALGEVHHPHLVRILDVGEAEGCPYLALSYVDGSSAEQRIAAGPMPLGEVLQLVSEVASGLDALHSSGVVHRDVKPSNVLLDREGRASLTDFGLAKGRDYTVLTRLGQVIGTLDYLAPELIKGQEATPASDIYALGCVTFECIAGSPPFAGKSVFQVGMAHLQEEPPDPCASRPDLPVAASAAVLQALAKEPSQRPATASAYAEQIRAATQSPIS